MRTLAQLTDDLRCGRVSSESLTENALAAIRDPDGEGSRTFVAVHAEGAKAAARAADSLRRAGIELSPLMGIPVSIKDLFDVAGETTRAGSIVLENASPAEQDATIVARLRAAGAVIVGRTNMVEFAYGGVGLNPHYGTPRNPWGRDVGRVPGGSSSGAAVSVTDGMCAAAIGTDTGGSVRIPAAFCGLTGFKPTARRIDRSGCLPLSTSLDSIGPLAASVDCCAQMDALLAGAPAGESAVPGHEALRFLVPSNVVLDDLEPVVARYLERALSRLSRAGARIVEARVAGLDEWTQHPAGSGGIAAPEAYAWHRNLLAEQRSGYDPRVATRLDRGAQVLAADYIENLEFRRRWIRRMGQILSGFDGMLLPTVAIAAPAIEPLASDDGLYHRTNGRILRNTSLVNFLDGCALTVPCHEPGEAPVGLMLAGPAMADATVLAAGRAIEAALSDEAHPEDRA